jgi:hypothetical protein
MPASLDLPSQFDGVGLQSLLRDADEKMPGSRASITADLIAFCRSKDMSVYTEMGETLN